MREIKELYWVAGIIEGEGCLAIVNSRRTLSFAIRVSMTDRDIIYRLKNITGLGSVTGPYTLKSGNDIWCWAVGRKEDVIGLLMTLYPIMGERRKDKIKEILRIWRTQSIYRNGSKITAEDAIEIRRLYKKTPTTSRELAKIYGLTPKHINSIVRKEKW